VSDLLHQIRALVADEPPHVEPEPEPDSTPWTPIPADVLAMSDDEFELFLDDMLTDSAPALRVAA
jgi:hypothetical protein